jgi:hypothetical protein
MQQNAEDKAIEHRGRLRLRGANNFIGNSGYVWATIPGETYLADNPGTEHLGA